MHRRLQHWRFFASFWGILLFILCLGGVPAFAQEQVQVHTIKTMIGDEPVTIVTQEFPESPLENPELVSQVNALPLDHVAMFEDVDHVDPAPEYENLKAQLSRSNKHVEVVKSKKGFFRLLRANWKRSFPKVYSSDAKMVEARKASIRYGLISMIGKSSAYTVMLITGQNYVFATAAAMVMAQTVSTFVNTAYSANISSFLERSLLHAGKKSSSLWFFNRRMIYTALWSEIYKLSELGAGLFSSHVQTEIFANTAMYGIGDAVISNTLYRAFKGQEAHVVKMKFDKLNFWVSVVSGLLVTADLLKLDWVGTVTTIGSYQLQWTGAGLIAYFGGMWAAARFAPEALYKGIVQFETGLQKVGAAIGKPVKKLLKGVYSNCNRLLKRSPRLPVDQIDDLPPTAL